MASIQQKDSAPSPTNSSDSNDQEFSVTAEMMVDTEDYEITLDEEEELEEMDDEDELADLQKEGDMPLEELLAMYYGNTGNEPEQNNKAPNIDETKSFNGLEKGENESSQAFNDATGNENVDEYDPFYNQRITRGLAALNSQYFDEEYSSDEDYQPTADDWKKEIQIGEQYQAQVVDGLSPYNPGERSHDIEDKLLWKPDTVQPEQLNKYLHIVYKRTDGNTQTPDRDDEQALYTLLQMKDVEKALVKRQEQERQPPDVSLWSEDECQNFEQGLRVFGKDFRLIQKNKVQTRSVGEIVQFYYLWKKTERHDAFVTQTKLGRRKYTLPGIADMMGRFMEENESVFSSRSASPTNNLDHQNTILYGNTDNTFHIKSELTEQSNIIKHENSYGNYTSNHNQNYYGSSYTGQKYDYSSDRTTANNDSWRTSPKPISIGSMN